MKMLILTAHLTIHIQTSKLRLITSYQMEKCQWRSIMIPVHTTNPLRILVTTWSTVFTLLSLTLNFHLNNPNKSQLIRTSMPNQLRINLWPSWNNSRKWLKDKLWKKTGFMNKKTLKSMDQQEITKFMKKFVLKLTKIVKFNYLTPTKTSKSMHHPQFFQSMMKKMKKIYKSTFLRFRMMPLQI
jgi:hypothetical protein